MSHSADKPLVLVVLGRQGSGKGTQCEMLESEFGIVHVSTGEMLREDDGSELSQKVRAVMSAGELVGDDITLELVAARLAKSDVSQGGVALDGFPRNPVQAEGLIDILDGLGFSLNLALNIDVPNETAIERMLERGREDDTRQAIERRLEIYEEQTAPLLEWFQVKGVLHAIDGTGTPEEVFKLIVSVIGNKAPKGDKT